MGEETSVSVKAEKKPNSILTFVILIAALVVFGVLANLITSGKFLEVKNMEVVVSNSIYPTFIGWALCFMFACGYTDMSLGGVLVLGSFGCCALGTVMGYPGLIIGGLFVATLFVFINFGIFATTRIPSWIASISLALVYEALAELFRNMKATKPYVDIELDKGIRALGQWPYNLIIMVVGFIIVFIIYNYTSIGVNLRAIGGNTTVARSLGINIGRTVVIVGVICGLLMGVACIIQESASGKTFASTGLTSIQLIFKPLAIALLAQVLSKWINIIIVVPFCSVFVFAVFNVMSILNVPSGTLQDVVLGALVIIFGVLGQRGEKGVVK